MASCASSSKSSTAKASRTAAKITTKIAMSKRHCSPAWSIHGAAQMQMPTNRTEFEQLLEHLHLSIEGAKESKEALIWVRRNKDRRWVPDALLEFWGLRERE